MVEAFALSRTACRTGGNAFIEREGCLRAEEQEGSYRGKKLNRAFPEAVLFCCEWRRSWTPWLFFVSSSFSLQEHL